MSSVTARPPSMSRLPDPAQLVVNTYTDTEGNNAPIPWRYNKQTGAIDMEFVNGFSASTTINGSDNAHYFQGQTFGAIHLVLRLGPNFVQWCETTNDLTADAGSVELVGQAIVAYGNLTSPSRSPNNDTFIFGLAEDPSLTIPAGPESSKYYKTLIFQKPLVIKYTVSGVVNYAYFSNNFEGNT